MYQWLLVRKYLTSKIMPLLASVAVLLCAAMVLVIWSVMGGFLDQLIRTGRTMTGDVTITWPNVGFAHYDDLIKRLEADPMVAAAAPMIDTYALLSLPNGRTEMVLLKGVEGESYGRVTAFRDIIWWKPVPEPVAKDAGREDPRLDPNLADDLARYHENGLRLSRTEPGAEPEPAVVMGIEVSGFNRRSEFGFYRPGVFEVREPDGTSRTSDDFMPRNGSVVVSVLPIDRQGRALEQATRRLPIANEFHSGVYEFDSKVVLVRLDVLQRMLRMDAAKRIAPGASTTDAGGGETFATGDAAPTLVDDPARVTSVVVRAKADLSELGASTPLRRRVEAIYDEFAADHPGEAPGLYDVSIMTWEDQNRTMIAAVQKETGLVLFLFSLVSLVAVFLVLAIFWSMIAEKTRDIGVLRAIGASAPGVAGVWVLYGAMIGVVGAILGGVAAWGIVENINPIHEWMGRAMGIKIWDPRIYYFTTIPTTLTWDKAAVVMVGGVLSSVVGAIVPAWRAARMTPVNALRFE